MDCLIQNWGVNQYVKMAFLCRICGKEQQSNHTGNWRSHYHGTHLTEGPVKCDVCNAILKNKTILRQHKKTMHENPIKVPTIHKCPICSQKFQRKTDVKKHVAKKHNIISENTSQSSKQKEFDVDILQPLSVKNLKQNVVEKAQSEPHRESRPNQASLTATNRHFICRMCYTNFKTRFDLKVHQDSEHFQEEDTLTAVYNCLKCSKSFSKHIELTNHTIENHGMKETIPGATLIAKKLKHLENAPDGDPNCSPTMVTKRQRLDKKLAFSEKEFDDSDVDDLIVIIKEEDSDSGETISCDEKRLV